MQKLFSLLGLLLCLSKIGIAQPIFLIHDSDKVIIKQVLVYYPELANTKITFKYRNQKSPFSTHIKLLSIFNQVRNRKYTIYISKKSNSPFKAILFDSLSSASKFGVIGHELAHVAQFQEKDFLYFVKHLFGHLSKQYIDRHEYQTDKVCLRHQLGIELLQWSIEVRVKLRIYAWGGSSNFKKVKRERYMNPDTIIYYLLSDWLLYDKI